MEKLEKLLETAFNDEDDTDFYENGEYSIGFEFRECESLFWILKNGIPLMEGNTLDEKAFFCCSPSEFLGTDESDFDALTEAIERILPEYTIEGEIYHKYLKDYAEGLIGMRISMPVDMSHSGHGVNAGYRSIGIVLDVDDEDVHMYSSESPEEYQYYSIDLRNFRRAVIQGIYKTEKLSLMETVAAADRMMRQKAGEKYAEPNRHAAKDLVK